MEISHYTSDLSFLFSNKGHLTAKHSLLQPPICLMGLVIQLTWSKVAPYFMYLPCIWLIKLITHPVFLTQAYERRVLTFIEVCLPLTYLFLFRSPNSKAFAKGLSKLCTGQQLVFAASLPLFPRPQRTGCWFYLIKQSCVSENKGRPKESLGSLHMMVMIKKKTSTSKAAVTNLSDLMGH